MGFVSYYNIIFTFLYLKKENYEFIMYIGIVSFFLILISYLHLKYKFSNGVLLGLSVWGLLHMCGGYFRIGDSVLYGYWIFPFLRYDMFVHAFGFGFATLLSYYILKPFLNKRINLAISIFLVFIGMGLGALNEIIEFIAVVLVPETGVGGYENTMLDIVFNTIGAVITVVYINLKERR